MSENTPVRTWLTIPDVAELFGSTPGRVRKQIEEHSLLAIRHGLPTAHVLARNGLSWKTPIFPGQLIRLDPIPDDLEWPAAETSDERDRRVG